VEVNRKSMCTFPFIRTKTDGRELFVMSKCPDGEDGEATMVNVMEKVGHKVSLNFTYIARYLYFYFDIIDNVESRILPMEWRYPVCMVQLNVLVTSNSCGTLPFIHS
jgi:hypothetical protein